VVESCHKQVQRRFEYTSHLLSEVSGGTENLELKFGVRRKVLSSCRSSLIRVSSESIPWLLHIALNVRDGPGTFEGARIAALDSMLDTKSRESMIISIQNARYDVKDSY
jgi:hypothetical protein